MRAIRVSVLALLLGTISAAAIAEEQEILTSANLPTDVTAFVSRRTSCDDLALKANADALQTEDADRIRLILKCNAVVPEEAALRRKYQDNSLVIAALDATWVKIVRRVPVQP
jgi:hypothetical protein